MKKLLFFFLLIFTTFCRGQNGCAVDFGQHADDIVYNQNHIDSVLDLAKYNAYFFAESHTIHFEPLFKLNFINHLNSRYGVKDVFMEIGYSAAWFFNQYLKTGDTSGLYNSRVPYLWGNYKRFWQELYIYNQRQPANRRVVIHGIDFERTEIFRMLEMARDKTQTIPSSLQEIFVRIQNAAEQKNASWNDKSFIATMKELRKIFAEHTEEFKRLYPAQYKTVEAAITNTAPVTTSVRERNIAWYDNISKIISEQHIQKLAGFFGSAHLRYGNKTSLSVKFKTSDFFKGDVLNISGVYKNFISTGGPNKIIEYGFDEKDFFEKYYDSRCRANVIRTTSLPKLNLKTESDFVLFAKEIVEQ